VSGSRDEDLMALVTKLMMILIGFLVRGLYEEEDRMLRSLDS